MTQEDKQLLLTTLCGMLPYGVRARFCDGVKEETDDVWDIDMFSGAINADYIIDDVKPYLRQLSSMTEEEKAEYTSYCFEQPFLQKDKTPNLGSVPMCIDWLNSHHFDYRGLIEKSLAIVAPEGMYKYEND